MPFVQVIAPNKALGKSQQDTLISRLSNAVRKAERAPIDDSGAQSLVWAYYHEMNNGAIYVGGENPETAPFRIAITTPEGALSDETRGDLVQDIGAIIDILSAPIRTASVTG